MTSANSAEVFHHASATPTASRVQDDEFIPRQLHEALLRYWGYESLRPLQAEAMGRVMTARDSLVVLPTGGGKSLCFQLPAVCQEGMALVVSPLISLMKDQVDALRACGVSAAYINSSLSTEERRRVAEQVRCRELKLLYVAPERLLAGKTLDFLQTAGLSLIAIDEAHCISSWGHDFRPEYRGLAVLKRRFPQLGIHAYTATAAPRVRQDIARQLELVDPAILVGNFDRPNLVYRIREANNRFGQLCHVLARHPGESGIVYCISRKEVEQTAASLRELGVAAAPYHAGLPDVDRKRNQEAFLQGNVSVIVATVAFGMGIDKPNVRFVVHARMPKSLEHYQQESGRAGRDGLPSECVLIYSRGDFFAWRKMLASESVSARQASMHSLQAMLDFCENRACRHAALVRYFGQTLAGTNCGACDVCLDDSQGTDRRQRPEAGASHGPDDNPSPGSLASTLTNLQSVATESGLTLAAVPTFRMFREGVNIADVSRRMNRAESTVYGYLAAYLRHEGITDWSRWVGLEVGERIEEALRHLPPAPLKPIFEYLQGEVHYNAIRVVAICVANRQRSVGNE